MTVGIINSIQIFLKINETTELELETSKHFYNLATDIHKILGLSSFNRIITPKECLDNMYRRYVELMEKSNLISSQYKDVLISLPEKQKGILSKISLANNNLSSNSSLNRNPLTDDSEDAQLYRVDRNSEGYWIFPRSFLFLLKEKTNQKSTKSIRRNSRLSAN